VPQSDHIVTNQPGSDRTGRDKRITPTTSALPCERRAVRRASREKAGPADVTGADLERWLVLFTPPAASDAAGRA